MITKVKNLLKDNFIRGTIFLTAVNFVSSFLNYLVHPVLARNLSISQYGDFQALLSFLTLGGVVAGVLSVATTKEVSVLKAEQREGEIRYFQKQINSKLVMVGGLLFFVLALFSVLITDLFHISSIYAVIIVSLFFVYTLPLSVNRGILTGLQKFPSLSINTLLDPLSKFLMVLIFVSALGWGLLGASVALALSGLLPLAFSYYQIKRIGLSDYKHGDSNFFQIFKYSVLVLVFTSIIQLFYNLDMIFVKTVFSPEQAGLYGALLTVGRIIFFVGGAVPLVMFPVLAALVKEDGLRKYATLLKSLALMGSVMLPVVLVMVGWPEFVLKVLVGAKYLSMARYLPIFTLPMTLLTIVMVFTQYFLALSDKKSAFILVGGLAVEVCALSLYHNSISNIIWSLVFSFGFVLLALVFYVIVNYIRDRKMLNI